MTLASVEDTTDFATLTTLPEALVRVMELNLGSRSPLKVMEMLLGGATVEFAAGVMLTGWVWAKAVGTAMRKMQSRAAMAVWREFREKRVMDGFLSN